jgi:hypothetical protein
MQSPIRLSNIVRANLALRRKVLQPLLGPGDIDDAVDDSMSDVDALRRKLPRDRITQRAQRPLAAGEGGHLRVGFDTCGGAGEDQSWRILGVGVGSGLEEEREGGLGEDEGSFAVVISLASTYRLIESLQD